MPTIKFASTNCAAAVLTMLWAGLAPVWAAPDAPFDERAVAVDRGLAAQLPSEISSRGTLIVGSDPTYPPAEFLGGPDGLTPQGIEVDLAKAVAKTLGLKLDFQTAQFDAILPAIGPKYDLGMSAFTITNARYGAVNFVSYFNAGKQWAVQDGNPTHFDTMNICGRSVGVQTGTTSEALVTHMSESCTAKGQKAVEVVSLGKQTDLITRLVNGAVDAVLNGSTNIGYAVKQTDGKLEVVGDITTPSPNGIAIAKGDLAFADLIAKTLNKLIKDGTYGRILAAWGTQSGAVPAAVVNPAINE